MGTFGELEQAIMDALWRAEGALSANDLRDLLGAQRGHDKTPAVTTVLTVLSRLENKGFVARDRSGRPHRYTPQRSRESHVADLMREVLENSSDRSAALAHFVGSADESEVQVLRQLLAARN